MWNVWGDRSRYRVLVGTLGRPRLRLEDNIKIYVHKME
jgi:hypothetical protein